MKTIPERCAGLPGMTRKRVPTLAHDANQLEESIAARVRRYFEARETLACALGHVGFRGSDLSPLDLLPLRNPRKIVAELQKVAGCHEAIEVHETACLVEELANILAPLLAQLPDPDANIVEKDC